MSDDLGQELRAFEGSEALANGDFSACVRGADRIEAQAARIADLEAALRKIADHTKRAHPQAQEGEIHQIAITVLTNNTQENINDINE